MRYLPSMVTKTSLAAVATMLVLPASGQVQAEGGG